jgi:hypothetical protein
MRDSRDIFCKLRSFSLKALLLGILVCGISRGQVPTTPALNCVVDNNDRMQIIIAASNIKLTDLSNANSWTLYSLSGEKTKITNRLLITDARITTNSAVHPADTYLAIILASPLPDDVHDITGIVATKTAVIPITKCYISPVIQKQTQAAQFKAATGKADSDIYFNGSYTASTIASPLYAIDAFAGYMHAIGRGEDYWGKLGSYGQVTTKSSSNPSPNSYLTYAVFQRVLAKQGGWIGPFQTPYLSYRLAGGEFDQTGNNLNFVTSPLVTLPLRFSTGTLGAVRPDITVPHMTLIAGVEFVKTISSPLPEDNWITRGLLGATFSTGYAPNKPFLSSIVFNVAYQVRLLSAPEVYYDSTFAVTDPKTGKKVTPPKLGTQPRHHVDSKLTYNFAKWAGATFEYSYGSLPPAFVLTHSTFALGLTFTLQQTSYGRYSILKP